MSMELYKSKNPYLNFEVVMIYKRPTPIRAQKNSDSLCDIFKSDNYVIYSNQTAVSFNQGHYRKGNHPFRNMLL